MQYSVLSRLLSSLTLLKLSSSVPAELSLSFVERQQEQNVALVQCSRLHLGRTRMLDFQSRRFRRVFNQTLPSRTSAIDSNTTQLHSIMQFGAVVQGARGILTVHYLYRSLRETSKTISLISKNQYDEALKGIDRSKVEPSVSLTGSARSRFGS